MHAIEFQFEGFKIHTHIINRADAPLRDKKIKIKLNTNYIYRCT